MAAHALTSKTFPHALLLSLLAFSLAASAAQGQALTEFNLYGGLSSPTGDFSDDSSEGDGYASFGFGAMGEYVQPVGNVEGLGLAASASLLVNAADEDVFTNADDVGRYFIIPVMGGLRYRTEFSSTLDGYGLGQVGLSASRGPSAENDDNEATSGFATTFGIGIGGGLVFNDSINVTVRYLALGEPEFEYEQDEGDDFESEVGMSVVQVMIGFTLGN